LSGFLTPPIGVEAAIGIGETDHQSSKNITTWSSYLPTDCVAMMVSLGWDRTT
jgi:hypothetical protein